MLLIIRSASTSSNITYKNTQWIAVFKTCPQFKPFSYKFINLTFGCELSYFDHFDLIL